MKKYFYVLFIFVLFLIPANVNAWIGADVFKNIIDAEPLGWTDQVLVALKVDDPLKVSVMDFANYNGKIYYDNTILEFQGLICGYAPYHGASNYYSFSEYIDTSEYGIEECNVYESKDENGILSFRLSHPVKTHYNGPQSNMYGEVYVLFNVKKGVSNKITKMIYLTEDNKYSDVYLTIIGNKDDEKEEKIPETQKQDETNPNGTIKENDEENIKENNIDETKEDESKIIEDLKNNKVEDLSYDAEVSEVKATEKESEKDFISDNAMLLLCIAGGIILLMFIIIIALSRKKSAPIVINTSSLNKE